jgi:hypothetical protein
MDDGDKDLTSDAPPSTGTTFTSNPCLDISEFILPVQKKDPSTNK